MQSDTQTVRSYGALVGDRGSRLGETNQKINVAKSQVDLAPQYKVYGGSDCLPLSPSITSQRLTFGVWGGNGDNSQRSPINIDEVSDLLSLSFGILRRKLTINWNSRISDGIGTRGVTYSRGTPSAGGLYPVDVYVLSVSNAAIPHGVYHYDVPRHCLARVRMGEFESHIQMAVDLSEVDACGIFLILTVRFQRTARKYGDFAFQLANHDLGASLGAVEHVSYALGKQITVLYWFDDSLISALLGVDNCLESPFAVVAFVRCPTDDKYFHKVPGNGRSGTVTAPLPKPRAEVSKKASADRLPDILADVHRATQFDGVARPRGMFETTARTTEQDRSSNSVLCDNLPSIMRQRETNWGGFRRDPKLRLETLEQILWSSVTGVQYTTDLYDHHALLPLLRVSVIANSVQGLNREVYEFSVPHRALSAQNSRPCPQSLQSIYGLNNFNLDQVAAIVVVTGKLDLALKSFGARGIRVMNAEGGIFVQRAYMISTACRLGCGVAAGFNTRQVNRIVGIEKGLDLPLLLVFLGHQVISSRAYEFTLK
jgi:SagB-type dehydrogenase family enzyme